MYHITCVYTPGAYAGHMPGIRSRMHIYEYNQDQQRSDQIGLSRHLAIFKIYHITRIHTPGAYAGHMPGIRSRVHIYEYNQDQQKSD